VEHGGWGGGVEWGYRDVDAKRETMTGRETNCCVERRWVREQVREGVGRRERERERERGLCSPVVCTRWCSLIIHCMRWISLSPHRARLHPALWLSAPVGGGDAAGPFLKLHHSIYTYVYWDQWDLDWFWGHWFRIRRRSMLIGASGRREY